MEPPTTRAVVTPGNYNGRVRYALNYDAWSPNQPEWEKLLSLVQPEEKERILRFKRPIQGGYLTGKDNPDAKSSLIGRLMLRMLIHKQLNIPYKEIKLTRTDKGKPYLENPCTKYTHFNFNVSHSDGWVICGSEPFYIIGIDVMGLNYLKGRKQSVSEFIASFKNCFTTYEWTYLHAAKDEQELIHRFFLYWTLKESYIKAIGLGLGFKLDRAEFRLNELEKTAKMLIDGKEKNDWWFYYCTLRDAIISVACGPPDEATNSKLTVKLAPKDCETALEKIPFSVLLPNDLIPVDSGTNQRNDTL